MRRARESGRVYQVGCGLGAATLVNSIFTAIAFDAGYDRARLSMADWMAVPRCHCFAF